MLAGSSGPRNALKTHGGFLDAAIPLWKYFELYLGLRYDYYNAAPSIDIFGPMPWGPAAP